MSAPEAEFDDASNFPTFAEMSERRKGDVLYGLARELFLGSMSKRTGEPLLSPERAFTLAQEFITEAARRKL